MKKQLYSALIHNQKILYEKNLSGSKVTTGNGEECDIRVELPHQPEPVFVLFEDGRLHLHREMTVSLRSGGKMTGAGQQRTCENCSGNMETWDFKDDDWVIVNIRPGFDVVLCYRDTEIGGVLPGSALLTLSQALESPFARAIVLSFAIHTAFLFFAGLTSDPAEVFKTKQFEARWVEMVSNVDEVQEKDKITEMPVIEDTDTVIIDDSLKDMNRPKLDDSEAPIANLDKVEKPVGLQAALGGMKLHDMESLFGSSAGLGNALDYMPETADGEGIGNGSGFGAGLTGIGFGGGGGGGGGYGTGIGGLGGKGGGHGKAKLAGPKRSKVKQKPKLALEVPKQGTFCKESNIREIVQKRASALRNCYEQQLLADPNLSGKIVVFWKIGLNGRVTDASIKSSTMNNKRVEACLTKTIRRLRFDKPDGGICVVEFPFTFTSAK